MIDYTSRNWIFANDSFVIDVTLKVPGYVISGGSFYFYLPGLLVEVAKGISHKVILASDLISFPQTVSCFFFAVDRNATLEL